MSAVAPILSAVAGGASGFLGTGQPSQEKQQSSSQSTSAPSVFTPSPSGYAASSQTYADTTSQALAALNGNLNMTRSQDEPYLQSGYNALDSLLDSVGVSRPTAGTQAYAGQASQNLASTDSQNAYTKAQQDYQGQLSTYNQAQSVYQGQLGEWQALAGQLASYENFMNMDSVKNLSPDNRQVVLQENFPNGKPVDPGPAPTFTTPAPTVPTPAQYGINTPSNSGSSGGAVSGAAGNSSPADNSLSMTDPKAAMQQWAQTHIDPNNPAYQFDLKQGLGAVTSNAAAKGMLNSGAFATDLNNYAQGAASQEFNRQQTNMQNILLQIASGGQQAANTNAQANTAGGTVSSSLLQTQGTNVAQAQQGASQYWNVGPTTQQSTSQSTGSATGATQGSPWGNAISGAIKGLQSGAGSSGASDLASGF